MQFDERLAIIRDGMAANGVDAVVAFSNAAHHIEKPDAVALLTGFKPMGESLALFGIDFETALYVTPSWDVDRAAKRSHAGTVIGGENLMDAIGGLLEGELRAREKIGFAALSSMPRRYTDRITESLGAPTVNVDDLLFGVTALSLNEGAARPETALKRNGAGRKTADELVKAKRATEIAELGYARMLEIARPGMREHELAWKLKDYMAVLGADDNFLMLSASPHNHAVMPSTGRLLSEGDIIIAEMTPCYQGQFSQICRTAILGDAGETLCQKYALVVEAMRHGVAAAVPGARMADVCRAIDTVLEAEGYGEYCHPPYIRRRGHGLGIGSVAPGNVSLNNEIELEEDMFFVIHPNQYLPETGYLLCGEPTRVAQGGGAALTQRMARLDSIAV